MRRRGILSSRMREVSRIGSSVDGGSAGRPGPLRVVVCDDHALMRSALRVLLTAEEGLEIVGEAATGGAVLPLVEAQRPDVVVLDLNMPQVDGFKCLELLTARYPDVKCVVLSATDDADSIAAALRRGAAGYVLKSVNPLDLPAALRQSVEASVFQATTFAAADSRGAARAAGLSEKEVEVLGELAQGKSNRQIAQALWLSEQTVKFHLRNVYRKLGVGNRTEALRLALDRHLVAA
jgi:DNA-binding NarL/FixJ family response regulator